MSSTTPDPASDGPPTQGAIDPALRYSNIGRLLLQAFDRFERSVIRGLREAGFTDFSLGHGAALRNIDLEGTRVSEVAQRAHMTKQGMSQLIKTLEKKGYVRVGPDPSDGRARLAFLTGKGEALIAEGQAVFRELEKAWREELGDETYETLRTGLTALGEAGQERP